MLKKALAACALLLTVASPSIARHTSVSHHRNAAHVEDTGYYTNVSGHQVHRPAHADSAPAGASARCSDGTYSFSEHRRGTCSHHGGVAGWL